ncbi:tRNA (cytidine/uridine-2'-O-)-methyltransferase [Dendrobium catenatum]|uniref:tRNA (Cytidine/uridine-2'-O-)-methyltransferase n=1 Tax=Dendrobium catenatum TaxID=906689 RepID=A0A2I0VYQ2_9ASPA|nr:tRNA (cytidine/uridine-2'-O-)-methyltransferase [Dendrobium catenatum]
MDVSSLRALNLKFCSIPFSPRPFIRPALLANLKLLRKFSQPPSTTISCRRIPGNTGCIARTCAASSVGLHLVESMDHGLNSENILGNSLLGIPERRQPMAANQISWTLWSMIVSVGRLKPTIYLGRRNYEILIGRCSQTTAAIFCLETCCLKPSNLTNNPPGPSQLPIPLLSKRHGDLGGEKRDGSEGMGGGTIRIPMVDTYVRCLNLSVSVGISLYEAARQLNYEQFQFPSDAASESQRLFMTEDIFG